MMRFDHVVIGGGIIGCSIAWHLARAGCTRVVVFERNELAGAASSRAAGLVLQITGKSSNTPLAQATLDAVRVLQADLGESIGFHAVGSVRVALAPACGEALAALAGEAGRHGVPCQSITAGQAATLVPWLELPPNALALYLPDDGYVDPYLLATSYARAARELGVTLRPRTAVKRVQVRRGRVTGVETVDGVVTAGTVIDAAGAWAALLAADAGYPLPIAPVRSHYWISEPQPAFARDHPVTVFPDIAAYARPETGGLLLGFQEQRSRTFDARELPDDPAAFSPTAGEEHWDILAAGAQAFEPLCPAIMSARFGRYVAGLSTYTPDGALVLGAVPGIEGFIAAAGCCGSGVALSGGIGAAVSDLALGDMPRFDLAPFDPARFGRVDPFDAGFRERCAAARAAKSRAGDPAATSGDPFT